MTAIIITDIIQKKIYELNFNILKTEEIIQLIESSLYLLISYIDLNPLEIMYPYFSNNITNSVHEILMLQISFLFTQDVYTNLQNNINDQLHIIIEIALSYFIHI